MESPANLIHKKRKRENDNQECDVVINEKTIILNKSILLNELIEQDNKQECELNLIKNNSDFWNKIKNENVRETITKNKEFIFGNYDKYYYKRYLEAMKDPRMGVIKKEWFNDKKCLDIGCNDGTLTLLIAVNYQPDLIEGIDIDDKLIKKAVKNLKYVLRNNVSKNFIDSVITNDTEEKVENIVEDILNNNEDNKQSTNQNDINAKIKVKLIFNLN